jgi:hypothetical protein
VSLDLTRLEKVVELSGGAKRARCPACAEGGHDKAGEHLRVYPNGKFGCCVFPGDREHRKRIFALVGDRAERGIAVRPAVAKGGGAIRTGLLGRVGRVFESLAQGPAKPDGSDGGLAVRDRECGERTGVRTPRTGETDSGQGLIDFSRTARTPLPLVTRGANETGEPEGQLMESAGGVRSVREDKPAFPHLLADGTLVIPFGSPERFHWWKGGQSVSETRAELVRNMERKECHGTGV